MLFGALDLFLVSLGLSYFLAMMGTGLYVIRQTRQAAHRRPHANGRRRHASAARRHSGLSGGSAGELLGPVVRMVARIRFSLITAEGPAARAAVVVDPAECVVYYLVPALDEERVIEGTVRGLLTDPRARVVVVDDASDDRTGELAAAVDPDRVRVVRRELPAARKGKGPALNAGFAEILYDSAASGIAPCRVIVCVMDADGRLSSRVLDAVLPLFSDDRVGGVQLPVRIRNRTDSLLTRLQDVEFWGLSAVSQIGRTRCGTVSLGGNGQFTRLTALIALGRDPWRHSLTEDLDLALALLAAGWRLTSTRAAYVSQQAITKLKPLIRQRTRWFQGHMQSGKQIPELWASRGLSHLGLLEVTMYLMVPWALVLPWSIAFHYSLVMMLAGYMRWGTTATFGTSTTEHMITIGLWYVLSFMPNYLSGYLYYRQDRRTGLLKALALGHLLLLGNYIAYVACWRALYRVVTGRTGWDKTARNVEKADRSAPAIPAVPVLAALVPAPRLGSAAAELAASREPALVGAGRELAVVGATAEIRVKVPEPALAPAGTGGRASSRRSISGRSGASRPGGHRAPSRRS